MSVWISGTRGVLAMEAPLTGGWYGAGLAWVKRADGPGLLSVLFPALARVVRLLWTALLPRL